MPVGKDTTEELQKYQTFSNQIGGHLKIKGVTCMIADNDGHLLKYVENSTVGRTEAAFYNSIFSNTRFLPLRKFVPHFYGTVVAEQGSDLLTYLKLENVIHHLDNPNIIDIKIGKVTHDPFAKKEKVNREYNKFPAQREIGFRISGMKVFNFQSRSYDCYNRGVFRSCSCYGQPQTKTSKYLKHFMGVDENLYGAKYDGEHLPSYRTCECCNLLRRLTINHLVEHIIRDLQDIKKHMEIQTSVNFYASSILLAYDTTKLSSISVCPRHKTKTYLNSIIQNRDKPNIAINKVDHSCLKQQSKKTDITENVQDNGDKINEKRLSSHSLCKNIHVPYSLKMIDFGHTYIDLDQAKIDTNHERTVDINRIKAVDINEMNHFDRSDERTIDCKQIKDPLNLKKISSHHTERMIDANYLFGLQNLVEYFKNILKEI